MIIRFLAIWVVISFSAGLWLYHFENAEKRTIKKAVWRTLISSTIGAAAIAVLYFANNIQGV